MCASPPDPGFPNGVCLVSFTTMLRGLHPKERILPSKMFKNHWIELNWSLPGYRISPGYRTAQSLEYAGVWGKVLESHRVN